MRWDTVLFDLDGTVTDPKVGITKAVAHALACLGYEGVDPERLTAFIGPPLYESFSSLCGFQGAQIDRAIDAFRAYYNAHGWAENTPYPGIHDFLAHLRKEGLQLAIATSKPYETAKLVLEHFDLARYFDIIGGACASDKASAQKSAVIQNTLSRLKNPGRAIMVGDRSYDVLGAHACGLPCIGVLYGYGSREELIDAKADFFAGTLDDLTAIIFSH